MGQSTSWMMHFGMDNFHAIYVEEYTKLRQAKLREEAPGSFSSNYQYGIWASREKQRVTFATEQMEQKKADKDKEEMLINENEQKDEVIQNENDFQDLQKDVPMQIQNEDEQLQQQQMPETELSVQLPEKEAVQEKSKEVNTKTTIVNFQNNNNNDDDAIDAIFTNDHDSENDTLSEKMEELERMVQSTDIFNEILEDDRDEVIETIFWPKKSPTALSAATKSRMTVAVKTVQHENKEQGNISGDTGDAADIDAVGHEKLEDEKTPKEVDLRVD